MSDPAEHLPVNEWSRELVGEIQIMIAVLFFGVSFIFQRYAMLQGIGPVTYNACRYVVSTTLLFLFRPCAQAVVHSEVEKDVNVLISEKDRQRNEMKELWWWGGLCGLAGLGGSILQQIGIVTVTAGKTGFITGMFVIFVPIVEWLTPGFGGTLTWKSWCAALISLTGLYLLSGCAESSVCLGGAIGTGEVIVFVSMLFWVVSIMFSDIGAKRVDVISLTTVDFFVTTIFTVLFAFLLEPQSWVYPFTDIRNNWPTIVLVGFTEALAFALSTLGQMYTPPTRASVLFSLEAVTCAVGSYFMLGERLSYVEIVGCCLMTGSALLSSVSSSEDEDEQDSAETSKTLVELQPFCENHASFGSMAVTTSQHLLQPDSYEANRSRSTGGRVNGRVDADRLSYAPVDGADRL